MTTRPSQGAQCIVIADNRETIDGLHSYLNNSGIATRTSRRLRDAAVLCTQASALVLFPDEYSDRDVLASIRSLRSNHPRLLVLLVSSTPQRLRAMCEPDTRSLAPVLLPKPAFGWSLLDVIRTHVQPP